MNVRVFLLIGMTAFFAVVWSSDQQYQAGQIAIARRARLEKSIAASGTAKTARRDANAAIAACLVWLPRLDDKTSVSLLQQAEMFERGLTGAQQLYQGTRCRLEEEYCWVRFRVRQNLYFAGRRISASWRSQGALRDLAGAPARERARRQAAARNAATPKNAETR